jgi:mannitol/fructose-specific phosphotransferase system IIA component (Ntr-type)
MATKLDQSELVTFKELLLSNSIQIDAAVQLLIDKGLITEQEFFTKLKQVQAQYQAKRNG